MTTPTDTSSSSGDHLDDRDDRDASGRAEGAAEAGGAGVVTPGFWRDPLALALAGVALVPFAVAIWSLLTTHGDLMGFGDNAGIELTTREVLSHPPLVGQVSRLTLHSPGPAMFYLLAPFTWLLGGRTIGVYVGAAVWNAALTVVVLHLAYRRGGRPLLLVTAPILAVLIHSWGVQTFADPWNPYLTLVALVAIALLAWAFAEGDDWALVGLVGLATFEVQTHLSTGAPVGVLVVVAFAARATRTGGWSRPWFAIDRRVLVIAVAAAAVLWLPPVLDTVLHPPGNLAKLAKFLVAGTDRRYGLGDGVTVARYPAGFPPSFVTGHPVADGPAGLTLLADPPVVPLGLMLLLGVGVLAVRRRLRDVVVPVALSLALLAAAVLAVWRLIGGLYAYVVLWTTSVSAFVWITIGYGAWRLAPNAWRRSGARVVAAALVVVACVVPIITASQATVAPRGAEQTPRLQTVTEQLTAALDPARPVYVTFAGDRTESVVELDLGLVLALVKAGYTVYTPGQEKWFGRRDRDPAADDQVVYLSPVGGSATAPDAIVVPPDARRVTESDGVTVDVRRGR